MTLAHERRGAGEPLVLLHGIGMSGRAWEPMIDEVAREREVITVDLPGFGASAHEGWPEPPTPANVARVVSDFFEATGLERPHVAGTSMGGGVALELARTGAVKSVVAFSPVGFGDAVSRRWETGLLRFAHAAAKLDPDRVPSGWRLALARAWSFSLAYGRPFEVSGEEIHAGTRDLIGAAGYRDALPEMTGYPWIHSRRARRALPRARHVDLPGCGHIPFHDDPELCARILLEGSSP